MAQRFGGRFSPGASQDRAADPAPGWAGRRRSRAGARINALFIVPAPLVLTAFAQEPVGLAFDLAAFGLLMAAAFMTREGEKAHQAFDVRRVARKPALPRKLIGAALTAAGLAFAGLPDPGAAVIFAVLGAGLHLFAFGPDPLRDKGHEDTDAFQLERVTKAVEEAEAYLAEMRAAIADLRDRRLTDRVDRFIATARTMFRRVEDDPRDLTGARRFLGVYLLGARDATVKFADLYARRADRQARADYVALLDDLEDGFATRTDKMLLSDRSDLDIEIEVLRDRLQREEATAPKRAGN